MQKSWDFLQFRQPAPCLSAERRISGQTKEEGLGYFRREEAQAGQQGGLKDAGENKSLLLDLF
jgi:hypothetical protein